MLQQQRSRAFPGNFYSPEGSTLLLVCTPPLFPQHAGPFSCTPPAHSWCPSNHRAAPVPGDRTSTSNEAKSFDGHQGAAETQARQRRMGKADRGSAVVPCRPMISWQGPASSGCSRWRVRTCTPTVWASFLAFSLSSCSVWMSRFSAVLSDTSARFESSCFVCASANLRWESKHQSNNDCSVSFLRGKMQWHRLFPLVW